MNTLDNGHCVTTNIVRENNVSDVPNPTQPTARLIRQAVAGLLAQAEASAVRPSSHDMSLYFKGARDSLQAALEKIDNIIQ